MRRNAHDGCEDSGKENAGGRPMAVARQNRMHRQYGKPRRGTEGPKNAINLSEKKRKLIKYLQGKMRFWGK